MSTITSSSSSAVNDQEKDKTSRTVTSILHHRSQDDSNSQMRKNKRKQNGVTFATQVDHQSIADNEPHHHKRRKDEDVSAGLETINIESNLDMTQDQVRQLKSIRRYQRQHKNSNNGTDNHLLSDDENEETKNSSMNRLSDAQYDDDYDEGDDQKATSRNHQRQQQQNLFVGEDMVVDSRNLSSEENGDNIPIEPFNMENERTDGSGYFDGDTFVFRRNQKDGDDDEEEDAWLENLDDDNNNDNDKNKTKSTIHLWKSKTNQQQQAQPKQDKKSKIELYQIIDSKLAKDNETVLQAIQRFGSLVAKQNKKQTQKKKLEIKAKNESSVLSHNGHKNLARESLDMLTECAQTCLMEYDDVSIYQRPKSYFQNQLAKLVKVKKEMVMADNHTGENEQKVIEWEYMGNADKKQIQGPFTTQQMISWIQAGYFVGANAVQVRSITTITYKEEKQKDIKSKEEKLENMLQDLEDSDDENENEDPEISNSTTVTRGEWLLSEKVSFSSYL